jgi:hypothetical protein
MNVMGMVVIDGNRWFVMDRGDCLQLVRLLPGRPAVVKRFASLYSLRRFLADRESYGEQVLMDDVLELLVI